jgi:FkbM family methyltransferase
MKAMIGMLRTAGNALSLEGRFLLPQSFLRRAFRHASGTYRVDDFDGDLSIDLCLSEHMQRRIFWMGYYNKEIVALLDDLVREGMVVVDVGANIGEISMVSAKRTGPSGAVIAFEPVDEIADELQKNRDRNQLSWLSVVRIGLSDYVADQAPVYAFCGQGKTKDENRGLGSLYSESAEGAPLQLIRVTTLDAYLDQFPPRRIDIIKVDIEGAELPFLRGARETIRRYRPLLIIEVQNASSSAAGYRAEDILGFLSDLGYTFERIGKQGRLTPMLASSLTEYQNLLCTPIDDRDRSDRQT